MTKGGTTERQSTSADTQTESGIQIIAVSHKTVYNHSTITSLDDNTRQTICRNFNLHFCNMPPANMFNTQSTDAQQLKMLIEGQTKMHVSVTIHGIWGDGNCLFRAISLGITGQQDQHQLIRDYIVNHMTKPTVRNDMECLYASAARSRNYSEHLLLMQQPGVWDTDQEIVAAAELFKFNNRINIQHFSPHFAHSPTCSSSCQHESLYIINSSGSHYELVTVTYNDNIIVVLVKI